MGHRECIREKEAEASFPEKFIELAQPVCIKRESIFRSSRS